MARGFSYRLLLANGSGEFDIDPLFRNYPESADELERALRKYAAPRGFAEARFGDLKILEFRYWIEGRSELELKDPLAISEDIPLFEIGEAIANAATPDDLLDFAEGIIEMFEGALSGICRYHLKVGDELVFESTWDGDGFRTEVHTTRPLLIYAMHLARKMRISKPISISPMDILRAVRNMADAIRDLGRLLERRGKRIVAYGRGQKILHIGSGAQPNMGPMFGPFELYIDRLISIM